MTPIPGRRTEHQGIRVQLLGEVELASERGHPHQFLSLGEHKGGCVVVCTWGVRCKGCIASAAGCMLQGRCCIIGHRRRSCAAERAKHKQFITAGPEGVTPAHLHPLPTAPPCLQCATWRPLAT